MSRAFWFVAGAGAGVYAAVRARRTAEILTADGLQDRVGAAVVGLRMFRDEVAQGKADAETGLRDRMGVALHGRATHRELPTPAHTDQHTDRQTDQHSDHHREAGST